MLLVKNEKGNYNLELGSCFATLKMYLILFSNSKVGYFFFHFSTDYYYP